MQTSTIKNFGRFIPASVSWPVKPAYFSITMLVTVILGYVAMCQWLIFYIRGDLLQSADFWLTLPAVVAMTIPLVVILVARAAMQDTKLLLTYNLLTVIQLMSTHPDTAFPREVAMILNCLLPIVWLGFLSSYWRLGRSSDVLMGISATALCGVVLAAIFVKPYIIIYLPVVFGCLILCTAIWSMFSMHLRSPRRAFKTEASIVVAICQSAILMSSAFLSIDASVLRITHLIVLAVFTALIFDEVVVFIHRYREIDEEKQNLCLQVHKQAAFEQLGEQTAMVVHDIRKPMLQVSALLDLLTDELDANSPLKDARMTIEKSFLHAERLISDVLHGIRQTPVHWQIVSVSELLYEALKQIDPVRHQHLNVVLSAEALVKVDLFRATRAIANILQNAIEIPSPGHVITIHSIDVEGDLPGRHHVRLKIHNTGSHIPDVIAKQEGAALTARSEGTGLGISIARKSMREIGGNLEIQNVEHGVVVNMTFEASVQRELKIEKNLWGPWPSTTSEIETFVHEHRGTVPASQ